MATQKASLTDSLGSSPPDSWLGPTPRPVTFAAARPRCPVKLSGKLQKLKWKKEELMEVKVMDLKLEKNLFSSLAVKMG
ncbi:hypothetical protein H8959_013286 [Pygathrix nigripes]